MKLNYTADVPKEPHPSGITPDPTPMWNNTPLGDLVTFNF